MKNPKQSVREASDNVGETLKNDRMEDYLNLAKQTFKKDLTIKNLAGLTNEKEEAIYGQAYLLYNTGRYKDSAEIFRVLIVMDSTQPKYMMGLAACFHMMKDYESAISTYTICSFLDPESPVPYFHVSDCLLQTGDKLSAMVSLEMAIKRAEGKPEFKTLKERSEITLNGLKKEEEENLKEDKK